MPFKSHFLMRMTSEIRMSYLGGLWAYLNSHLSLPTDQGLLSSYEKIMIILFKIRWLLSFLRPADCLSIPPIRFLFNFGIFLFSNLGIWRSLGTAEEWADTSARRGEKENLKWGDKAESSCKLIIKLYLLIPDDTGSTHWSREIGDQQCNLSLLKYGS